MILKWNWRNILKKAKYRLKQLMNEILAMFSIKIEVWHGEKMTDFNCRQLMKDHNDKLKNIKDVSLEIINKFTSNKDISDVDMKINFCFKFFLTHIVEWEDIKFLIK